MEQDVMLPQMQQLPNEEEKEVDINEEIDDNKLMAYDIAVFYNTYNLSTLLKWWGNKLVVPTFQRSYVWTKRMASEFVDSILRGLPVPALFFYNDTINERLLVVDGQQRLCSLYAYIKDGKFGNQKFDLIGNIHPNWKNKTYNELNEDEKDRLNDALMNITVMRQLAPDDGQSAMYLAFQRINTGGTGLKAQEIRMAVSYGPLALYLDEIASDSRFDKWVFLRTSNQRVNNNNSPIQELILKLWAYYFCYPEFPGSSTRVMLDEFFDTQKDFDSPKKPKGGKRYYSKKEFEDVFNAAFSELLTLDKEDFSPSNNFAPTLMEAIWVGLTYRKLKLNKSINVDTLKGHIANWKNVVGLEKFSELFQSRRSSSATSAFDRVKASISYFSIDF